MGLVALPMSRALLALMLLPTAIAGCLDQGSEGPVGDEPDGTYQLAWIEGTERLEPPPEGYGVCDVLYDHGVDVSNRTLTYRADGYAFEPANVSSMVAWDIWDHPSSCPLVYRLQANVDQDTQQVGAYGTLQVAFEDNGTLMVKEDVWLEPGQNTTIAYNERVEEEGRERWRNGTIHVWHFDGWPTDRLQPS